MVHQLDCPFIIFILCVGYSESIVVNISVSKGFEKKHVGPFNESMPHLNNTKYRCVIGPSNRLHLMKTQTALPSHMLRLPHTCYSPQEHPGFVDSQLCGPGGTEISELILCTHR